MSSTQLLVSVRSAEEAEAALAGGADVIDIKEPAHGPLGQADDAVLSDVVRYVAGRRPVSAALGELSDGAAPPETPGLAFVKWGLARWAGREDWQALLLAKAARLGGQGPRLVVAAYVDWENAAAPPLADVVSFALGWPGWVLLLDTYAKDGVAPGQAAQRHAATLFDWLTQRELDRLCARCRDAGVRIAVAGSLGSEEVPAVCRARPDWLAVRTAACLGGRHGTVSAQRVRRLRELLA